MTKPRSCGVLIRKTGWQCFDNSDTHMCSLHDGHPLAVKGEEDIHACALCEFKWKGSTKLFTMYKQCDTCGEMMEEDDFMGVKVFCCIKCQEVTPVAAVSSRVICPLGSHRDRHSGSGSCKYGYCDTHCKEYHSNMADHDAHTTSIQIDMNATGTSTTTTPPAENKEKPEPQPLVPFCVEAKPTDVKWR